MLLYLFATVALAREANARKIPFTLVNGQPQFTLTINRKPMQMLFDIGSNATIVSKIIGPTSRLAEARCPLLPALRSSAKPPSGVSN